MSCFKCEKRNYPYCYEYCEDYLREKEEREKRKAEKRELYHLDSMMNDYVETKYRRLSRKRN